MMMFFKLPSLWFWHKKRQAGDLEELFELPEEKLVKSPRRERNGQKIKRRSAVPLPSVQKGQDPTGVLAGSDRKQGMKKKGFLEFPGGEFFSRRKNNEIAGAQKDFQASPLSDGARAGTIESTAVQWVTDPLRQAGEMEKTTFTPEMPVSLFSGIPIPEDENLFLKGENLAGNKNTAQSLPETAKGQETELTQDEKNWPAERETVQYFSGKEKSMEVILPAGKKNTLSHSAEEPVLTLENAQYAENLSREPEFHSEPQSIKTTMPGKKGILTDDRKIGKFFSAFSRGFVPPSIFERKNLTDQLQVSQSLPEEKNSSADKPVPERNFSAADNRKTQYFSDTPPNIQRETSVFDGNLTDLFFSDSKDVTYSPSINGEELTEYRNMPARNLALSFPDENGRADHTRMTPLEISDNFTSPPSPTSPAAATPGKVPKNLTGQNMPLQVPQTAAGKRNFFSRAGSKVFSNLAEWITGKSRGPRKNFTPLEELFLSDASYGDELFSQDIQPGGIPALSPTDRTDSGEIFQAPFQPRTPESSSFISRGKTQVNSPSSTYGQGQITTEENLRPFSMAEKTFQSQPPEHFNRKRMVRTDTLFLPDTGKKQSSKISIDLSPPAVLEPPYTRDSRDTEDQYTFRKTAAFFPVHPSGDEKNQPEQDTNHTPKKINRFTEISGRSDPRISAVFSPRPESGERNSRIRQNTPVPETEMNSSFSKYPPPVSSLPAEENLFSPAGETNRRSDEPVMQSVPRTENNSLEIRKLLRELILYSRSQLRYLRKNHTVLKSSTENNFYS